ncbi:MAG: C-terminal binding protein [Terracidiphilus sp.]|jgi:D-3-phosphoglycerate dehydrogenase
MGEPLHVVITDSSYADVEIERSIIQSSGAHLQAFQCKTEQDVIEAAKTADAMLVQWAPITRAVIEQLSRTKVIVRYGVGIDNVDLEAARARGIAVCNVPNYCIDEVADHTFALAMALARQIPQVDRQMKADVWSGYPPRPMLASRQMTFVTLGYGRIARAVLERAQACKFKVATCDPYLAPDTPLPGNVQNLPLDHALASADILSLHVPLTDGTRQIIDAAALCSLKSSAILINTARGGLVDGFALADALKKGRLAGAGLDVFEKEPLPDGHPLRECANVLLSSHIAWYSELSISELRRIAAEEIIRGLTGQPLLNRLV